MTRSLWVNRSPFARNISRIQRELWQSFGRLGIRDYLVETNVDIVTPPYNTPQTGVKYMVYMRLRKTPTGPDCHVYRWIKRLDLGFRSGGRLYRWELFTKESDVVPTSVGPTLRCMVASCRDAATGALLRPLGYVLYDGPSEIDGEPIVVILTGVGRKSDNPKTGAMLQTWILRSDLNPVSALATGDDRSICGDCPARDNWCYVSVHQAPRQVWKSWKEGRYQRIRSFDQLPDLSDRMLRMGAYGNPSAAPFELWEALTQRCKGHTGYEHNWRDCDPRFKRLTMASCDSIEDWIEASRRGWRTFRSRNEGEPILTNELTCPASHEAGQKTTCENCRLCDGRGGLSPKSITILAHGAKRKAFAV